MDYKVVKAIIDRYFAGETSLEEEAQLRAYFSGAEVDDRLKPYKPLFVVLQQESERSMPDAALEKLWQHPPKPAAQLRISTYRRWIAVAASVALAIALWRWYPQQAAPESPAIAAVDWSKYEVTDPEEALRITKKALGRTSRELNRAAEKAAQEITKVKKMAAPLQ